MKTDDDCSKTVGNGDAGQGEEEVEQEKLIASSSGAASGCHDPLCAMAESAALRELEAARAQLAQLRAQLASCAGEEAAARATAGWASGGSPSPACYKHSAAGMRAAATARPKRRMVIKQTSAPPFSSSSQLREFETVL